MQTYYQSHVGNESPILENLSEISCNPSPISRFPSPKIQFSSHEIQFSSHEIQFSPIDFLLSSTAFRFLQWLSAFFNSFPLSSMAFHFLQWLSAFLNVFLIFLNSFPIFLNGFPLSEKSEKIYLRRQVYERSPFELRISCHSLPELRNCHLLPKLRNCYNACISPNSLYIDRSLVSNRTRNCMLNMETSSTMTMFN